MAAEREVRQFQSSFSRWSDYRSTSPPQRKLYQGFIETCDIARKAANDLEIAHLLLGLLTIDDSSPANFLSTSGIDAEHLTGLLQKHLPTGVKASLDPPPLTDPLHQLSITAWDEARHLDSETVEPDHLLLAVLLSDDLVVRKVSDSLNVNDLELAEKLRQRLQ
ncbi:MAG: Clp protein [Cyanobacteriota bacterium erpe_2018_sw_39hr_WHONDRS-SW48-000098_B_bin.30]|nr:Clp protein [Cyanobacteriota bacterium erpe_2018_sw_39hr_WHONDRS-SW48-000098_B_bin.30]